MEIVRLKEIERVAELLQACNLPADDLHKGNTAAFFGFENEVDGLVGVVGLEVFGRVALLRSLAVSQLYRGRRFGEMLAGYAEAKALERGVDSLYLLTTTAEAFFLGRGYQTVDRDQAPPAIRCTAQFDGLCPASAVFMSKVLLA